METLGAKSRNKAKLWVNGICGGLLIISTLVYLTSAFDIVWFEEAFLFLIIGLSVPCVLISNPLHRDAKRTFPAWYDLLMSAIALGIGFYFFMNGMTMRIAGWEFGTYIPAVICSFILLGILLECTRRTNGWLIFGICVFFVFLPMFAGYLPGMFKSLQFDFARTISAHVMGPDSVLGPVGRVCGRLLVGYLLFSAVLVPTGGGQFFLDIAMSFAGKFRGAPGKIACIASGLFGMLSGSAVSNVMTTGSFTIPAMIKNGYKPHYAAAVEACAATGGSLMPPVMGAAAFVMAELTETPYWTICAAAILPALLYYLILFMQADSYAGKMGLTGLPKSEIPSLGKTLKNGWPYFFTLIVLVWFLIYVQDESMAPFYATAAMIIAVMISKENRPTKEVLVDMIEGSGKLIAEICILLFSLGVVFGALSIMGLATTISFELANLAGGNVWILPVLTLVAGTILGMGLPTTASYILLAVALAPAMIKVGFGVVPSHLFCLYAGILSYIIPPVALSAIAGAKIAGEKNIMKVGFTSMRLGGGLFVLPFYFIFVPALLLGQGPLGSSLIYFAIAAVGMVLMSGGFEGFLFKYRLNVVESILITISGILIAMPELWSTVSGIVIGVVILVIKEISYRLKSKRSTATIS